MATYLNSNEDILQLRDRSGMFMVGGDCYAAVSAYVRGALSSNERLLPGWDLFVAYKLDSGVSVATEYEIVRPMGEETMKILAEGGGSAAENKEAIRRLFDLVEDYVRVEKSGELQRILDEAIGR